jgi:hypothetical protein
MKRLRGTGRQYLYDDKACIAVLEPLADGQWRVIKGVSLALAGDRGAGGRERGPAMSPQELLAANGISLHSTAPGRYYTTCPQCSRDRTGAAHQRAKVLGVTIEGDSVRWGCNHCNWSGPEKGTGKSNGGLDPHDDENFVAKYDYAGFQKVRYPKGHTPPFRIRHRVGNKWEWGAGDADTGVLYRIDEVNEAIAQDREIAVVEGEKDANNLWAIGIPATCNAHGASKPDQRPKWTKAHSEQLRGARIIVFNDNDPQGYAHAEATCSLSLGIAKHVRKLELAKHWPECPEGGDISDWFDAGHTREELDALIARAQDHSATPQTSSPPGGWQFHNDKASPPMPWLIKNLLPETGAGLLSGQWGTYKTTTALDVSVSVMAGLPFAGRFKVKRRGGVAYFAVEGSSGLRSRLDTIARERGVTGALPFAWRADCPPLTASNALEALTRMAKEAGQEIKRRFSVPLVLIYIDTMIAAAAYANAGDDNDTAVAQKVMSVLSGLSHHTGALVLGIDHFGKIIDTGTRGSSAKEGHADVVLALLGDRQLNGTITNNRLAVRKLREGVSGLELPFAPRDVTISTDEDEEEITRKVLDWNKQATSTTPDDTGWSKSLQLLRRILMTMLADAGSDVMPFADGPVVRAVDLKLIRAEFYKQYPADGDAKQQTNVRRQAFNRAIKDAQAKSLIMVREVGGVQLVWLVAKTEEPTS